MEPHERIIVALDVDNLSDARLLVAELQPYVGYFKVGLELLTNEGAPKVVNTLKEMGAKIFYDGKFMDIPNTVAGASRAVAKLGVDMFNVHASGGREMVEAAVANRGSSKVLVVTVLTSIDNLICTILYGAPSAKRAVDFANMASVAGAAGVICSPKELVGLKGAFPGLLMVTPGVRPDWASPNDQKRIMTPAEAIREGADYLVIGRPITRPPEEVGSPARAAQLIINEIKITEEAQQ